RPLIEGKGVRLLQDPRPPFGRPVTHAAEADSRNSETGVAEGGELHRGRMGGLTYGRMGASAYEKLYVVGVRAFRSCEQVIRGLIHVISPPTAPSIGRLLVAHACSPAHDASARQFTEFRHASVDTQSGSVACGYRRLI